MTNHSPAVWDEGQGEGGDDPIDRGGEFVLRCVRLHQLDVLPAARGDSLARLIEHRVGQIDADNPAFWADCVLQQRKTQPSAAAHVYHQTATIQVQHPDCLSAPLLQPAEAAGVIVFCQPAVDFDDGIAINGGASHYSYLPCCADHQRCEFYPGFYAMILLLYGCATMQRDGF